MKSFRGYRSTVPPNTIYARLLVIENKLFRLLIQGGSCHSRSPPIDVTDDKISLDKVLVELNHAQTIVPVSVTIRAGHVVGVLFDVPTKTFTLFDPGYDPRLMSKSAPIGRLVDQIQQLTSYRYRMIPCYKSYQGLTGDFYCAMWVLMVMYLVCANGLTIDQVINQLNTYSAHRLIDEIEGFINFVYQELDRLGLIHEAKTILNLIAGSVERGQYLGDIFYLLRQESEPLDFLTKVLGYQHQVVVNDYNTMIYILSFDLDPIQRQFLFKLGYPMDRETYIAGTELFYSYNQMGYIPTIIMTILDQAYPMIISRHWSLLIDLSKALENDVSRYRSLIDNLRLQISLLYRLPDDNRIIDLILDFLVGYLVPSLYRVQSKLGNYRSAYDITAKRQAYYQTRLGNSRLAFYLTFNPVLIYNPERVIYRLKQDQDLIQVCLDQIPGKGSDWNRSRDHLVILVYGIYY